MSPSVNRPTPCSSHSPRRSCTTIHSDCERVESLSVGDVATDRAHRLSEHNQNYRIKYKTLNSIFDVANSNLISRSRLSVSKDPYDSRHL